MEAAREPKCISAMGRGLTAAPVFVDVGTPVAVYTPVRPLSDIPGLPVSLLLEPTGRPGTPADTLEEGRLIEP